MVDIQRRRLGPRALLLNPDAYIGCFCRNLFANKFSCGIITAYLPPEANEGVALWHIIYVDGDEEDLYEKEVQDGVRSVIGTSTISC